MEERKPRWDVERGGWRTTLWNIFHIKYPEIMLWKMDVVRRTSVHRTREWPTSSSPWSFMNTFLIFQFLFLLLLILNTFFLEFGSILRTFRREEELKWHAPAHICAPDGSVSVRQLHVRHFLYVPVAGASLSCYRFLGITLRYSLLSTNRLLKSLCSNFT